jgi:hypothetical protein
MMPDRTFALLDERMRWKIHCLEEVLFPPKPRERQAEEGAEEEEDSDLAQVSCELRDPPLEQPLPPTPEELASYGKEHRWLQSFHAKVLEAREAKGIHAAAKWKRLKSDPLSNESSTLNYFKSI